MHAARRENDSIFDQDDNERAMREVSGVSELPREMVFIDMKTAPMPKERTAMLGIAIAGGLGTFLPWLTLPVVGSINGTAPVVGTWGWLIVSLFALTARDVRAGSGRPRSGGVGDAVARVAPALAASALGVIGIAKFYSFAAEVGEGAGLSANPFARGIGEAFTASASVGVGLFLIAAAGPAILAMALAERRGG